MTKYKSQPPIVPTDHSSQLIAQLFAEAVALHQNGKFAAAETGYRQILTAAPSHCFAHNNLGVLLQAQGRLDEAVSSYQDALRLKKDYADAYNNLGTALHSLHKYDNAIASYQSAIRLNQNYPDAHYNLGKSLRVKRRLDEAITAFRNSLNLRPDYLPAQVNLANTFYEHRCFDDAIATSRQILLLKPDYAGAYITIGNTLMAQGQFSESAKNFQHALSLQPNYAEVRMNLGLAHQAQGMLDLAVEHFQKAIEQKSDFAETHFNLANALRMQGKLEEAVCSYRRALQFKPEYVDAYCNLGVALLGQGKVNNAIDSFQKALTLKPSDADALANLGAARQAQGLHDEAIACFRSALAISPKNSVTHSNLLFCLNYHPTLSAHDIYAEYSKWNATHARSFELEAAPHSNQLNADRRLKIGYVSPDFRHHSVIHFAAPLVEQADRLQFEIYCYYNHSSHDEYTTRIQAAADHWIPCIQMNDEQLAQRIRADGIDILIDLAGHTVGNRLLVFARKPAPVQATCFGFGYTTGLTAIDYFIGDPLFTPPAAQKFFSEKIYALPNCFVAYTPPIAAPEPSALPALRNGYVTFACLSRPERINRRVIAVWAEVLQRIPTAVLRLDSHNFSEAGSQNAITEQFSEFGINRDQLQIGFTTPAWDVYQAVDIVLDCFPHNSGTTTFEALWMGIPVITLAERPSVGRIGSSILGCLGKSEWIAENIGNYVDRAVALASDISLLRTIRSDLRNIMRKSPLTDSAVYVHEMSAAYRKMWDRYLRGERLKNPSAEPRA